MVFYGFTTLASALLNARNRFVAAAFAPVVNNVVVIGRAARVRAARPRAARITDVGAALAHDLGLLLLLGIGTTAGIVAMALVLVPAVPRGRPAAVRARVARPRDPHDPPLVGLDDRAT